MKLFTQKQLREARDCAAQGEQALHIFKAYAAPGAPAVFRRHKEWAHLFDQDEERLIKTVKRLGVRVIKVERRGQPLQHIDLCGKPLERAKAQCEEDEDG